ncbi:hypothetical protein FB446DRAFT_788751 [Lentinula raphanica]|nr:hypothetical protein FB446DRAFT_788751 [Lentinula raphanica]
MSLQVVHRTTASGDAEFTDNYQHLSGSSNLQSRGSVFAGHRDYPSPTPSIVSSANAPSPSAYSFPESQLDSSIGPSAPNRIMTRGQRKAAAAINATVTASNRPQTPRFITAYPSTPDSVSSSSAATRQLSASPALSSISTTHSHTSQSLGQQQQQLQYQMSMSSASTTVSSAPYGFYLPGPQLQNNSLPPSSSQPPPNPIAPRPYAKPKQRKQRLFNVDRKAICEYHMSHPNEKQELIARRYGVERSTISKILKHKEKWLNMELGDTRGCGTNGTGLPYRLAKHRPTKFPPVELEMQRWLIEISDQYYASLPDPSTQPYDPQNPPPLHGPFSDTSLREKARTIARSHGITSEQFKASTGWVENFKQRHGIKNGFWSGYLRNVQGRNAMAARGLSFSSTIQAPPPLASALASKLPSKEYVLVSSSSKAVLPEEEESDSEFGDEEETEFIDSSYTQTSSSLPNLRGHAFSRPPLSTDSSSTSTSGENMMSPHPGHIYNTRPPWSSGSSHPSTPSEAALYRRQHSRSMSSLSMATLESEAPFGQSHSPLQHAHARSTQNSHMSQGQIQIQHAQSMIEQSPIHQSHQQHQDLEVHFAVDPRQTSYTADGHNHRSGQVLPSVADTSSAAELQAYPSQYPPADLCQQPQNQGSMEHIYQRSSARLEHTNRVQYEQDIHSQAEMHMQTMIEAPLPPPPPISDNSMPTLDECEVYLTKLCQFANGPGQDMLSLRKKEWLRKLKVVFFQAGSGVPIPPDSDEER